MAASTTLFDPAFSRRRFSNTCFCLRLISFLVDSHKPDPADLGDDEKAECWAPEGMKGAGGGPWGGHMTRGRQWLKPFCAPTPTSGSGPALEGFGDFLPPPTRQTDVERSPVLRAPDTTAGCFSPADGTRDHRQNSYTSLTKELGPVRCGFKPTLCVCSEKLNSNGLKNNPLPPCLHHFPFLFS